MGTSYFADLALLMHDKIPTKRLADLLGDSQSWKSFGLVDNGNSSIVVVDIKILSLCIVHG